MAIVWPLRPNWRSPYAVTYQYQTQVWASRAGREQRRALRETPRKSVEFLCTVHQDRFRTLFRALSAQLGEEMVLPEVVRSVKTAGSSAPGSAVFSLAAVPAWISPGEQVIVAVKDRAELRTVDSVAGSNVTFEEENTSAWPSGAKICPALTGRLADRIRLRQLRRGLAEGRIEFDVDPGSELPPEPPEPAVTWNGREVLLERINWADPQDLSFERPSQRVDYGRGRITVYQPIPFVTQMRSGDFLLKNRTEAERLLAFFHRMRGRQGEFYFPSDEQDMQLAAAAGNGALTLNMAGPELAQAHANDPVARAISVLMRDGRRFYREVEEVVVAGTVSTLNLATGIPYAISADEVAAISWLPVQRLSSDELTIEWLTDEVAQTRLTFQSLEALPAEAA